ncbi:recombinase family protein [Vibrio sp. 10N.261.55.B8]|uniref:recombinase family protein n=1 Tax=unclassified Vibrio TaxID=2614977 RepID=UPI00354F4FD1
MSVGIEQKNREKIAYSYVRYSSKRQEFGDSFRRQTQQTKDFCEKYGYTLANQFEDLGISGFKDDQEALQAFIKDCELGKIKKGSLLIVESLDRLSRKQTKIALRQLLQILEYVDVYSHHEQKFYRSEADNSDNQMIDLMMSIMIMSRAHNESLTKQKRLLEKWEERRNQAHKIKLKGSIPYWLEVSNDSTKFIVKKDRIKTIHTMYEMAVRGFGAVQILKYLNANLEVHPTPKSRLWGASTITKLLSDRRLIGEHQFYKRDQINKKKKIATGELLPDYYPTVIDEELFYEVQSSVRSRKIKAGRVHSRHFSNVFRHFLKCGFCGSSMAYVQKGSKSKGSYLTCSSAKKSDECSQTKHYRYKPIEHIMIHLASANGFMPKIESNADLTIRYEKLLDTHEKEQKQLEMLLSRDLSSTIILDKIEALDSSVKHISSEIQMLEDMIVANNGQYEYEDLYRDLVLLDDEVMKYSNRAQFNSHMQQEIEQAVLFHQYDNPCIAFKMKNSAVHTATLDEQTTFGGCSLSNGTDTFKRLSGQNTTKDDQRLWELLKHFGDIVLDVRETDLYQHDREAIEKIMKKLSFKISKYLQNSNDKDLFEEIFKLTDDVYKEIGKKEKVIMS